MAAERHLLSFSLKFIFDKNKNGNETGSELDCYSCSQSNWIFVIDCKQATAQKGHKEPLLTDSS